MIRLILNFDTLEVKVGISLDERAVIARLKSATIFDGGMYMNADVSLEINFDKGCCSAFKKDEGVAKILAGLVNGADNILVELENSL